MLHPLVAFCTDSGTIKEGNNEKDFINCNDFWTFVFRL
jgi:hypothetical protein